MDIHELNFLSLLPSFYVFYCASNYLQTIAHINEDLLRELSQKRRRTENSESDRISVANFQALTRVVVLLSTTFHYPIVCIRMRVHERNDAQMVVME